MHVVSVNISSGGIPKIPHPTLQVNFAGLEGDGHNHEKHRSPVQAVSLIDIELLESMAKEGHSLRPGELGENLTCSGAALQLRGLGDLIQFSSGLELRITKVRTPCYVLDEISTDLKRVMWNRIGLYAEVTKEGMVAPGDEFTIIESGPGPRPAVREVPKGSVDGADTARQILESPTP